MPSRLLQLFGSYDLFGKSVPGAVLMLGFISFLPKETIPNLTKGGLLNIAALLLILLLTGLMIGQGVHTLADNIEKVFLWLARRIRHTANYLRASFNVNLKSKSFQGQYDQTNPPRLAVRILYGWWNGTIEWFRRRIWGTYDSLVGHRYLFAKSLKWNFNPDDDGDRWKEGEKGEVYERFAKSYEQKYGADIRERIPQDIVTRYPLIVSSLGNNGSNEYRQFQATYSFCRSMWVVLLFLSISYADLIYTNFLFGIYFIRSDPALFAVINGGLRAWFPLLLFAGVVVFFDASGTYKRHYVEYLIAEFGNSVGEIKQGSVKQTGIHEY